LPSETMIWQPEFTDKTLSRKPGAVHHVQKLVPDLTDYQWYKGYADVIDKLVTKCWQEEAFAEAQLRKVTR
ncbi:antitermination protein, partial [Escherichia coli]